MTSTHSSLSEMFNPFKDALKNVSTTKKVQIWKELQKSPKAMELCSMLYGSLDGRRAWGRMDGGGGLVTKSCLTIVIPWIVQHARPCCPWDSPGKNTGLGCHFLLLENRYIYIYMAESICCSPDTITILLIGYSPIQKEKCKKKKKKEITQCSSDSSVHMHTVLIKNATALLLSKILHYQIQKKPQEFIFLTSSTRLFLDQTLKNTVLIYSFFFSFSSFLPFFLCVYS